MVINDNCDNDDEDGKSEPARLALTWRWWW